MVLLTLDTVVKRNLLEKGLPIHYYFGDLLQASSCIRELAKDTLKMVNTVTLPVNSYGAIDLPQDFMQDVSLCSEVAGVLRPMIHQENISPLRKHDPTTGLYVENTVRSVNDDQLLFGNRFGWGWYWNVDSYGAPTGAIYGAKGGTNYGYTIVKERRQIQLNDGSVSGSKVLQYISNGQSVDNASQVPFEAHAAIQAYIGWKNSPNANNNLSYEAHNYYNEKRHLRIALDDMTIEDIINATRNSFTATIKN
jgi:hypothetical protein